jgi:hypothetical protein
MHSLIRRMKASSSSLNAFQINNIIRLCVMLSQTQIHKTCQKSSKPFVSHANVEGPAEVGKIWFKKIRASFN